MESLTAAHAIVLIVHLLLFVYWLGGDLGVFVLARTAKRSDLGFAERLLARREPERMQHGDGAIERGLRDGEILGVVSTNALELGIDIGSLDAAVLVGVELTSGTFYLLVYGVAAAAAGRKPTVSFLSGGDYAKHVAVRDQSLLRCHAAGGALEAMLTPFRFGLGGRLGSGTQWMSWIALDDLVHAIAHCLSREDVRGPVNGVAPGAALQRGDDRRDLPRVEGPGSGRRQPGRHERAPHLDLGAL